MSSSRAAGDAAREALAALLVALLCACPAPQQPAGGSEAEPPVASSARVLAGPVARAGPDQRALEGLVVRLDARGSERGESGRPLRFSWAQTAGASSVSLDDPGAAVAHFVAPKLPLAGLERRYSFALTVDDGARRASDELTIFVGDDPRELVPAPLCSAGADQEVLPGAVVQLGIGDAAGPAVLEPECRRAPSSCGAPPELHWEQTEGPAVVLATAEDGTTSFVAPAVEAVLTFRFDAEGCYGSAAACAGGERLRPTLGCAADFVRVFTRSVPDPRLLDRAPLATVGSSLAIDRPISSDATALRLVGSGTDPDRDSVTALGFRPVLGTAPLSGLDRDTLELDVAPGRGEPGGEDPRTLSLLGFAFETQAGRLRSAPVLLAPDWQLEPPIADAGPDPRRAGCSDQLRCGLPLGGETITLRGGNSCVPGGDGSCDVGDPRGEAAGLDLCWVQTFGPKVELVPGPALGCASKAVDPFFVAPQPPDPTGPFVFLFQLTVATSDGVRKLWSVPDTVAVAVGSPQNGPPVVVVGCATPGRPAEPCSFPVSLDEEEVAILDASASFDPEGGALVFRWQQLEDGEPVLPLEPAELASCANPEADASACVVLRPEGILRDRTLRFSVTAVDPALTERLCGVEPVTGFPVEGCNDAAGAPLGELAVEVGNTVNEPPVANAGADFLAKPGSAVLLDGTASADPNGDPLTFRWEAVSPGLTLQGTDTATPTLLVPAFLEDAELVLKLQVDDGSAASEFDDVTVHVLAGTGDSGAGPYVSGELGDDAAVGARAAPVRTIRRGLELAGEQGFGTVHVATGLYPVDADGTRLVVSDVELLGGYAYDGTLVWSVATGGATTQLQTGWGVTVAGSALVADLVVVVGETAPGGAPQSEGIRLGGTATLRRVSADASLSSADAAAAVVVTDGSPTIEGGRFVGGGLDAFGLACSGAARLSVGPAAERSLLVPGGPFEIHGGEGPGSHTALFLGQPCSAELTGGSLVGATEGGSGGGLVAVGLDSESLLSPVLRGVTVVGGHGTELALGARLVSGTLEGCFVRGGSSTLRSVGVEVPAGAAAVILSGGAGSYVVGGAGAEPAGGGAGSGAEVLGLDAASAVNVLGLELLAGCSTRGRSGASAGAARLAVAASLGAGGTLHSLGRIVAVDPGSADVDEAVALSVAGVTTLTELADVSAGAAASRALALDVLAGGVVELGDVALLGSTSGACRAAGAVRIAAGGALSSTTFALLDSGPAAAEAIGVESAGSFELVDGLLLAGPAPAATGARLMAPATLHSSLVLVRPGAASAAALELAPGSSGTTLRNLVLDAGGTALTRSHLLDGGDGFPAVVEGVLLVPDAACGAAGAYARSGATASCTPAQLAALGLAVTIATPLYDPGLAPYHPAAGSPVIDAGVATGAPALDADGRLRGGDGDGDGVAGYDIGPYER